MADKTPNYRDLSEQERRQLQERRDWEHRLAVNIQDNEARQRAAALQRAAGQSPTSGAPVRSEAAAPAGGIGPQHEIGSPEVGWRATSGPSHQVQGRQGGMPSGLNPRALPFQPGQQARPGQQSTGKVQSVQAPPFGVGEPPRTPLNPMAPLFSPPVTQQGPQLQPPGAHWPSAPPQHAHGGYESVRGTPRMGLASSPQTEAGPPQTGGQHGNMQQGRGAVEESPQQSSSGRHMGPNFPSQRGRGSGPQGRGGGA
ncbi:MAG: hypothetical protein Q9191_000515 [Dirinaria sp. TL-2023a]